MASSRRVVYGSYRLLQKAAAAVLRDLKAQDPLTPVWVVTPGNLVKLHLLRSFAETLPAGHVGVEGMTFLDLARRAGETALRAEGLRPLGEAGEWVLFREAVAQLDPAGYFGEVRHARGLPPLFRTAVRDLVGAGFSADDLEGLCSQAQPVLVRRLVDLIQVMRRVQAQKAAAGRYDDLDLMSSAVASAADLPQGAPLLLYGFYDLAPVQRRLLEAVLPGRPAVAFCPVRPEEDASSYARPTVDLLESRLGFQRLELAETLESVSPRIVSAPNSTREAQEVAREVVRHVRKGVPAHRVGVLLRQPGAYAEAVVHALEGAGIPVHAAGVLPLDTTPLVRSYLALLRIRQEDFPRPAVLEVATSGVVDAAAEIAPELAEGVAPVEWEKIAAGLGIVGGLEEWRTRLAVGVRRGNQEVQDRRRAADDDRGRMRLEASRRRLLRVRALEGFVEGLARKLRRVPDVATWPEFATAMRQVLLEFFSGPLADAVAERVQRLADGAVLDTEVSLAEAMELLAELLRAPRPQETRFERGGVLVAELMKARGIPFDVVVVPGLVEGVFPLPAREDRILPDRARMALNELQSGDPESPLALKVSGAAAAGAEDRFLFRLACQAASVETVLTYPRTDGLTGGEKVPSGLLLREIEARAGTQVGLDDLRAHVDWVPLWAAGSGNPRGSDQSGGARPFRHCSGTEIPGCGTGGAGVGALAVRPGGHRLRDGTVGGC